MSRRKVVVDTTIVIDALFKSGDKRSTARHALESAARSLLPVFAIKELARGYLQYLIWFHNRLSQESIGDTVRAIGAVMRQPNRLAAAQEWFAQCIEAFESYTNEDLGAKYGPQASSTNCARDQYLFFTKRKVISGWDKRRSLTTEVVCPLSCFEEDDIEVRGDLLVKPRACVPGRRCEMARIMARDVNRVESLRAASAQIADGESRARAGVLKRVKKGYTELQESDCRKLGDAVFAFLAPSGFAILTTNQRHHGPLGRAVNVSVVTPGQDQ